MIKIATVVTGFPIDIKETFDALTGVDTSDMCEFYGQLEVDNENKMEMNDGKENQFKKEYIQTEISNGLTEDKAVQKFFRKNHNNLKNHIELLCKDWLQRLQSKGLNRIYDVNGNVHYVSDHYYNQVHEIEGYETAK